MRRLADLTIAILVVTALSTACGGDDPSSPPPPPPTPTQIGISVQPSQAAARFDIGDRDQGLWTHPGAPEQVMS